MYLSFQLLFLNCLRLAADYFEVIAPYIFLYFKHNKIDTSWAREASRLALWIHMPEVPGSSPVAGNIHYIDGDSLYVFEFFQKSAVPW